MGILFGTDGIRGRANLYPITPEVALSLGKAIAHVFGAAGHGEMRAVIGKDTRISGYMLEQALAAGLVSMGMDALLAGPIPTPAVAHLTKSFNASCGIMITASHNPSEDNGIKIFGPDGFKLDDVMESEIEKLILPGAPALTPPLPSNIGKAYRIDDARGRYIEFAKASVKNISLKGLKIVLDCAHGASYIVAPLIFKELGAEVITRSVSPDGLNINAGCGALYPEQAGKWVLEHGADIGITLDGDADRVIFVDERGQSVSGDRILGMCALDMKSRGRLNADTLVVTSMSNLGLIRAMSDAGIRTVITDVGDRYVIEAMRAGGYNMGGEQSGHVIFMDYVTTGDGIISALHLLKYMKRSGKALSELAGFMDEYPQKMLSLPVREKKSVESVPVLWEMLKSCAESLGGSGRIVTRYSGTERKIRVLIESEDVGKVEKWSHEISLCIKEVLGE